MGALHVILLRWAKTSGLVLLSTLGGCGGSSDSDRAPPGPPGLPAHLISEAIRTRLEEAGVPARLTVGGDSLFSSATLPGFYERRGFAPAWSDSTGPLPAADSLVEAIRGADREGLRPADYHLQSILVLLATGRAKPGPEGLADLDLLLSDAFLILGSHLLSGRVNPETFDPEWRANRRGTDLTAVLDRALAGGGVTTSLNALLPPQDGYRRLRLALEQYRAIALAGGWPDVAAGPVAHEGDRDPRIARLQRRLAIAGDRDTTLTTDFDLFDARVTEALRRFQGRHGLDTTGVLNEATVAALTVPVTARVRQIELNLERWRWLPQDLGARHVFVNIAASDLRVEEDGRTVLAMRVIVGQPFRRTPVFSDTMRYVVLSPYWNVPENIAVQDKLPLVKRDPDYFARQQIKVFEGWGADTREVDPATVDWKRITPRTFRYHLRQEPGPQNALGAVKFMFPNKYNVYLHDTPTRELFGRADRTLSSGCIRLERPIDLAAYILGDQGWTREQILAVVRARVERTVSLRRVLPVHLLFWTAWVDEDGKIEFRRDPYGRDQRLETALQAPAPGD